MADAFAAAIAKFDRKRLLHVAPHRTEDFVQVDFGPVRHWSAREVFPTYAKEATMNVAPRVVQGFRAFAFSAAGVFNLVTPRQTLMQKKQGRGADFSDGQGKFIGLAEDLGVIGLIVPWATGILPVLTPLAAICVAMVMGGSDAVHLRPKEPALPPHVIDVLPTVLAGLRF